jgi:hypothetical protein
MSKTNEFWQYAKEAILSAYYAESAEERRSAAAVPRRADADLADLDGVSTARERRSFDPRADRVVSCLAATSEAPPKADARWALS